MRPSCDYLIIGAGLAGSILAWSLKERGAAVRIVTDPKLPAASRAAAGLINPVTGQRLVLQENIEALLDAADSFYGSIESRFGIELLHRCDMLRLFRNEKERDAWRKRREDPAYRSFIEAHSERPDGFIQHQTGWLDTNRLLDTLHDEFRQSGVLIESGFRYDELECGPGSLRWRNIAAGGAIFCEGWRGKANPWFSHLPFQPAKGEILTMKCDGEIPQLIVNRGKWLLPVSRNSFKLGATYDWNRLDESATPEAASELLAMLPQLFGDDSAASVTGHVAGVRPGTMDKNPFVGIHPDHKTVAIFNGFGSKGSLLIPWHAERFADNLLDGRMIPARSDIARFDG